MCIFCNNVKTNEETYKLLSKDETCGGWNRFYITKDHGSLSLSYFCDDNFYSKAMDIVYCPCCGRNILEDLYARTQIEVQ